MCKLPPTVPVTTKHVVVLHFAGEPGESAALTGKDVTASVQVVSPAGNAILAHSATGKFAASIWPEMPSGLDITVELPLRITEYGTHEIIVSDQTAAENSTMEGRTNLYLMEPPKMNT
jgi:hypothetical protein